MGFNDDSKKIKRTSAGIVILRQHCGAWHVLILRAWSHWDFPKGSVELGESLMQAAVREVKEETGITELSFPWGGSLARTSIYSRDKVAYYAIAKTETENVILLPNPQTGVKEHDEFKWVDWESLPQYLSPRLFPILHWVAAHAKLPTPTISVREFCSNSNIESNSNIDVEHKIANEDSKPLPTQKTQSNLVLPGLNENRTNINAKKQQKFKNKYKKRHKTSCSIKKK